MARMCVKFCFRAALVVALLTAGLSGCSWQPEREPAQRGGDAPRLSSGNEAGARIARHALATLGTPYVYGGQSLQGFDCSGLVQFAHSKAGIAVPRTAAEQQRRARPVSPGELQPGDLVFFRIGQKIAHVGIYVDDGRFVHAPATGREVSMERLDSSFYRKRLAGIGRFH